MKYRVIFDLDGTLADGRGRLHLLPSADTAHLTHSWDKFNLAAGDDLPILDNIRLMNNLYEFGNEIIILSGRCDIAKELTEKWLYDHGCNYHKLIMRPQADHRKDIQFKEEKLREIGLDTIYACFDDLEHVAKHLRSLGLTCHLVTHYDEKRVDNVHRIHYAEYKPVTHETDHNLRVYFNGYNKAINDCKELNK